MNRFTEHPSTVGETYWQHFGVAMSFTGSLLKAAACCALHAVFPFAFSKTASAEITVLYDRMVTNRENQT